MYWCLITLAPALRSSVDGGSVRTRNRYEMLSPKFWNVVSVQMK